MNRTALREALSLATLLVFAAAGSLFFMFVDDAFHITHSTALVTLWHVLPAVGGAAILSYLDGFRGWCLKVCKKLGVQLLSLFLLAVALGLTVISLPIPLTAIPGSRIIVDSVFKPATAGTSTQVVRLRGLAFHRVEVVEKTENDEFSDTVEIGPADIFRLWWKHAIRPDSALDPYRLVTSRSFAVNGGGAARFVYVSGPDFPKFYLRNIERSAEVERRGDTATVSFQLYPRDGMSEFMRVPAGKYRVWLDRSPCPDPAGDTVVAEFGTEPTQINFARCKKQSLPGGKGTSNDVTAH
jgi:hypothetical protein